MKTTTLFFSFLLLLSAFVWNSCQDKTADTENEAAASGSEPIFKLLDAKETGVDFINKLDDDPTGERNVLSYPHYYNGAGVAIGDINNDGLPDLFFSANEAPNRLYLNKGNLQFEDITEKANVNQNKKWSAGCTMADVNADGYLDIFVAQAGYWTDPKQRQDLLFINNGDLTFTEKAAEYGLNDGNQGTQAAFFDYDKDGDLDCYIMNESKYVMVVLAAVFEDLKIKRNLEEASGHLYRNDNGKFTRVTEGAGMLRYGYGLGLVTNDIDGDGWTDLYVANDYSVPDFMYLNQGNGKFNDVQNTTTRQISFYGMGADIADFNNDGYPDIFVVDMAANDHFRDKTLMASMDTEGFWTYINEFGYQYAYMFNSLQLNNGNGSFSNIAAMSGLLRTDWSWAALMADFDNDGLKDVFISNGFRRYARDNDFRNEMKRVREANGGTVPLNMREEMYKKMPEVAYPNFLYKNNGDLTFTDMSKAWGMGQETFSNGAAYGDLDNDGDLDLIVNNVDQPATVYQNLSADKKMGNYIQFAFKPEKTGGNVFNTKVTIFTADGMQYQEFHPVRGYEGSMDHILHFGIGGTATVDKVQVEWQNGKIQELTNLPANQRVVLDQNRAAPGSFKKEKPATPIAAVNTTELGIAYNHQENFFNDFEKEVLLPHKQSTLGPGLASGDVNGDGLDDVYIGGAANQLGGLFFQKADGTFQRGPAQPWDLDQVCEDMGALFYDADNDGDLDLYVASGGGGDLVGAEPALQDRLYINMDGKGGFAKVKGLPTETASSTIVRAADFDKDGDLDLFVGGGAIPGKYPFADRSFLLRYDNRKYTDVTQELAPELMNPGMVKDATWTDLDGDGYPELAVVGEWMPVSFFKNDQGKLRNATTEYGTENLKGWWYSVAATDIDGDGDMDFVLGNVGKNTKFYASEEKPFHVFANDFDKNGSVDIVLSKEYKGNLVPSRGRQCSSEQMPFIKEKFPTYKDFASAELGEILGEENLENALHLQVNTFASKILINNGGKFEEKYLPLLAQISPINRILPFDYNGDGKMDLLVAGNMYDAEVETPRYDAGNGLVLIGDGAGNFEPLRVFESGFYAPLNAKDMVFVNQSGGKKLILVANNNGPLQAFRFEPANQQLGMR